METGALMAVNADAHGPDDFMTPQRAEAVALGAGVTAERYGQIRKDMEELVEKVS